MNLTKEWLEQHDTNSSIVNFVIRNKLIGFPLNRLDEIKEDYNDIIVWIKDTFLGEKEYNSNNKLTYIKTPSNGIETWISYDERGNVLHSKDSLGIEYFYEYDSNDNVLYHKQLNTMKPGGVYERWMSYDSNNNEVYYKSINTFGVTEEVHVWIEYDSNNNLIYSKDDGGYEEFRKYDTDGNLVYKSIFKKDVRNDEFFYEYDSNKNKIHTKTPYYEEWCEYDINSNLIHYKCFGNIKIEHLNDIEYYDDGQLKRYGELEIPWFEKD